MKRTSDVKDYGECAYCSRSATTKDHIPPQTIYAKGTRVRPWVPSCKECNNGSSLDDEYLQRLSLLKAAENSTAALEVEDKLLRAIGRPQAMGLRSDLLGSLSIPEGEQHLAVPNMLEIAYQGDRLERIISRLVRGWFFKLTSGRKIPNNHEIMIAKPDSFRKRNEVYRFNEQEIRRCTGFRSEKDEFSMQIAICPCNYLSCWLFRFYSAFEIMAFTVQNDEETFTVIDLRQPYETFEYR